MVAAAGLAPTFAAAVVQQVSFASQPEDERECSDAMASLPEVARIFNPVSGW